MVSCYMSNSNLKGSKWFSNPILCCYRSYSKAKGSKWFLISMLCYYGSYSNPKVQDDFQFQCYFVVS